MKNCKWCSKQFEPKSDLAIFCTPKCRQKAYRKNVQDKLQLLKEIQASGIVSQNKPNVNVKDLNVQPKTNYAINTGKPVQVDGEDTLDYSARVNEWKKSLL